MQIVLNSVSVFILWQPAFIWNPLHCYQKCFSFLFCYHLSHIPSKFSIFVSLVDRSHSKHTHSTCAHLLIHFRFDLIWFERKESLRAWKSSLLHWQCERFTVDNGIILIDSLTKISHEWMEGASGKGGEVLGLLFDLFVCLFWKALDKIAVFSPV